MRTNYIFIFLLQFISCSQQISKLENQDSGSSTSNTPQTYEVFTVGEPYYGSGDNYKTFTSESVLQLNG